MKNIVKLGLLAGGVYLLYRVFTKKADAKEETPLPELKGEIVEEKTEKPLEEVVEEEPFVEEEVPAVNIAEVLVSIVGDELKMYKENVPVTATVEELQNKIYELLDYGFYDKIRVRAVGSVPADSAVAMQIDDMTKSLQNEGFNVEFKYVKEISA